MTTFSKKTRLLSGLLSGNTARTGPFTVTVDVTRRCNLKCPGCRYHSENVRIPAPGDPNIQDMDQEMFGRLCKELKAYGTETMVLLGEGEPFVHPGLVDLVAAAKDAGFEVILYTNGTLLDESRLRALVALSLDVLKVSMWASSEEEYERNDPGASPANFTRTVNSLKDLARIKAEQESSLPSVVLHRPISRDNYRSVEAMPGIAHETGADQLSFSPVKTRKGHLAFMALSPGEEGALRITLMKMKSDLRALSLQSNIDQTLLRYRIGEAVWEKMPCYIGWIHARIKTDGTVMPCNPCNLPVGSLRENTFEEIWNGPALREFRGRTITHEGLVEVGRNCECGFCCHTGQNLRVHKVFKWCSSLRRASQAGKAFSVP